MRRSFRRFVSAIGRWGFTIMLVPKRGKVRRMTVPWLGVIALGLTSATIFYFIVAYPELMYRNHSYYQTICAKDQVINGLRKENNQVRPVLDRAKEQEDLLNELRVEQAEAMSILDSVRKKSTAGLASRSGSSRPQAYRLPEPVIAPDGSVSLLNSLDSRLDSLHLETQRQLELAQKLQRELQAYETELDHTPNYWPIRGHVTSGFGFRYHPIDRRSAMHYGIDISAQRGTPVRAAADGVVETAGWQGGYGWTVVIRHGYGYQTLYGHNTRLLVTAGQRVNKGQIISYSGSSGKSTGPHLHFGLKYNGKYINPLTLLR